MTNEQLELEINHILDSGANSTRLATLFHRFANQQTLELQVRILQYRERILPEWDRLVYDEHFGISTDRQGTTNEPPQSEKYSWWQ